MNHAFSEQPDQARIAARPSMLRGTGWHRAASALLIVAVAFAVRATFFGDPLVDWDEQFYLLVGDRMLHGELPYVDIWDRKPIGLFLIYAATRLLGGAGIVQYQIVATLFVAATGIVVALTARMMTSGRAALAAGIVYVMLMNLAGGMGGQSPVFYNLFVAIAALLTLRLAYRDERDPARVRRTGIAAMLLVGAAMQVKYNALFEGIYLGLVLSYRSWLATRRASLTLLDMALFVFAALFPTLAALGTYAWLGHAHEFIFANFLSIGARVSPEAHVAVTRLLHSGKVIVAPFVCLVLAAALKPWRAYPRGSITFGLVTGWFGSALLGYLLFGTYFNHYILPVMVPLTVGLAPALSIRRWHIGVIAGALLLTAGAVADVVVNHQKKVVTGSKPTADKIMAAIMPNLRSGCLYLYDGFSFPYYLSNACIPTRYAFPPHLNQIREADALGVDQMAEIRRIMATRPTVVVDMVEWDEAEERPENNALFRSYLPGHYAEVARVPARKAVTIVYRRID